MQMQAAADHHASCEWRHQALALCCSWFLVHHRTGLNGVGVACLLASTDRALCITIHFHVWASAANMSVLTIQCGLPRDMCHVVPHLGNPKNAFKLKQKCYHRSTLAKCRSCG